jgi:hypothetical protein
MAAFVWPGDTTADTLERLGCVADFLAEAVPAWAARLEHEPAGDSAVTGLHALCSEIAKTLHGLARPNR